MENRWVEMAVGFFIIIGMLSIGYLTVRLAKSEFMGKSAYEVFARFQSVSGLKTGASVEMAGVKVGRVEEIHLEKKTQVALVRLKIYKDVDLSSDVIASVTTSGLIGDKFIRLSPGGSEKTLKPGEFITETESAVNLEELIGKYVFGGVDKSPSKGAPEKQ
jgi:phospholipid/cholesterol/gamma-HCH transport system substrate-binding protein